MLDEVPQHDRKAAVEAAQADDDDIVLAVVLDVGEWNLLRLELVPEIEAHDLDGCALTCVLLGKQLQKVMPIGRCDLISIPAHAVLSHALMFLVVSQTLMWPSRRRSCGRCHAELDARRRCGASLDRVVFGQSRK